MKLVLFATMAAQRIAVAVVIILIFSSTSVLQRMPVNLSFIVGNRHLTFGLAFCAMGVYVGGHGLELALVPRAGVDLGQTRPDVSPYGSPPSSNLTGACIVC